MKFAAGVVCGALVAVALVIVAEGFADAEAEMHAEVDEFRHSYGWMPDQFYDDTVRMLNAREALLGDAGGEPWGAR